MSYMGLDAYLSAIIDSLTKPDISYNVVNESGNGPSRIYIDANGNTHHVYTKKNMLNRIFKIKVLLGVSGASAAGVNLVGAYASAAIKQIASKIAAPITFATAIGTGAVLVYEQYIKSKPDDWVEDITILPSEPVYIQSPTFNISNGGI